MKPLQILDEENTNMYTTIVIRPPRNRLEALQEPF